jgi:predicted small lipoprotein YifL
MNRLLVLIFSVLLLATPLSACGKKGDPEPSDKSSTYPQKYPKVR